MSTVRVSTIRLIGRVFRITAVKAVHLLTTLFLLASGLPGPESLPAPLASIAPFKNLLFPNRVKPLLKCRGSFLSFPMAQAYRLAHDRVGITGGLHG